MRKDNDSFGIREAYHVYVQDIEECCLDFEIMRTEEVVEQFTLDLSSFEDTRKQRADAYPCEGDKGCKCCRRDCTCFGEKVHILSTKSLRKVRDNGAQVIRGHLFPLFSRVGNELFALFFLVYVTVLFGLSVNTFIIRCPANSTKCTFNQTQYANYTESTIQVSKNPIELVRFVVSAVSVVLALLNTLVSMRRCYAVKQLKCLLCCKHGCNPCQNLKHRPRRDSKPSGGILRQANSSNKSCAGKLETFWVKYVNDFFRLLIVEALLYPTLICGILDNAGSRTYEGTPSEKFKFGRFIFSCASIVWNVYIVRLIVLGSTIHNLEKLRTTKGPVIYNHEHERQDTKGTVQEDTKEVKDNKRRARRALVLEIFFLFHVFGQMLTQALMIVAIWSKVQCENSEKIEDAHFFISPLTWSMIALGFVVPIVGTLTFFIPTFYWGQEYPIDFMINFLSALKKTAISAVKKEAHERTHKALKFAENIGKYVVKRNIFKKLLFPFVDPVLIAFCIAYDTLLLAFAAFYFIGQYEMLPESDDPTNFRLCSLQFNITHVTDYNYYSTTYRAQITFQPTGWFLFGAVGIGIANIANIAVIINGLLWGVLIPGFFLPIGFLVPCLLLFFPCLGCYVCQLAKEKLYLSKP